MANTPTLPHEDSVMLDFLDAKTGSNWIARESVSGRGFRLHQSSDAVHATARDAIRAAMRELAPASPVSQSAAVVDTGKCRKCGASMKPGQAIEQTFRGVPDFPGTTDVMTVSPGGPGHLVDCEKCESCGWSVTA